MDFILVENRKNKKKNKNKELQENNELQENEKLKENKDIYINKNLLKTDIINNKFLQELLEKTKPYTVILYISSIIKSNINSDINLILLWKKNIPSNKHLDELKQEIQNIFSMNINFLYGKMKNILYHNLCQDNKFKYSEIEDNDKIFIENVYIDGVIIYGDKSIDNILFCQNILKI